MDPNRFFCKIILILASLSLLSCGGESIGKDVDIELLPSSPLVSKSNFLIIKPNGDSEEITGPWFGFSYIITNNSELKLVVQSFEAEITARGNGSTEVTTLSPDFGFFDSNRTRVTTTPIEPGDSFTEPNEWPASSLPELASFRYRVKLTFVGYFETEDDPDTPDVDEGGRPGARFEKTLRFTTR